MENIYFLCIIKIDEGKNERRIRLRDFRWCCCWCFSWIGEDAALSNESLYRRQQIEKLKKEKEALEALGKDSDEMSMDELDNVRAKMSRK